MTLTRMSRSTPQLPPRFCHDSISCSYYSTLWAGVVGGGVGGRVKDRGDNYIPVLAAV